ncbi:MAG: hypothetical protein AB1508_09660 [Pseudomonadota bacterium]
MSSSQPFNAGLDVDLVPEADAARQAVSSLRGYVYQVLAAALAWLDIADNGRIFLEVAEDYAIIANGALTAVQVKDTEASGTVTLNSASVRDAVAAFVDLVTRNPELQIEFRYFTSSAIGLEHAVVDRPAGIPGLEYWRKAASGGDLSALRALLEGERFSASVNAFVIARDDVALRRDLLRRIQWDCGQPDVSALLLEFKERLIVIGRDRFSLPASEAERLSDPLIYHVLKKSIIQPTKDRVLTRSELYKLIDGKTRISVRRSEVDVLLQLAPSLMAAFEVYGQIASVSRSETDWLIDGDTVPDPAGMIPRPPIESQVSSLLRHFGICILVGPSGVGKSSISRRAASAVGPSFSIIDFRDLDSSETRRRLDVIFARVGDMASQVSILEDLNHLDDPQVELSFTRVIAALSRRDRVTLVTCYRKPSTKLQANVGITSESIIECPYFTKEEVAELVLLHGGRRDPWASLAYVASAAGHPLLTHAFIVGMEARGWPAGEVPEILERGFSTDDVDAARDAARQALVSSLPDGARNMLYRLSIIGGRFERTLAITLGNLSPPVPQAGECLDRLVGSWVEAISASFYKVSPLASTFGREMLGANERKLIHEVIAIEMLGTGQIHAIDAELIFVHALAGKSESALLKLAISVLRSDVKTLEMLAEYLTIFRVLRTDGPIFPDNLYVSGMLRLAQFKLLIAARDQQKTRDSVAALFGDIQQMSETEAKSAFEAIALSEVLITPNVANYLDNWIWFLRTLKQKVESNLFLRDLKERTERPDDEPRMDFFGALFAIGCMGLASVPKLEHIVRGLDELDPSERELWLKPSDQRLADYSYFVNGPWALQQKDGNFDASDAVQRYRRMAEITNEWNIRPITIQCWVAQATILDEYADDQEGAFAVLDEAIEKIGDDKALARTRAKIFWRHNQHPQALEILRRIADEVGENNPIERAFSLRQAAISAAKCDDWPLAKKWFLEAQVAARRAATRDMLVMSVGLGADAAVAALKEEDTAAGLVGLAQALEGLTDVDPDESLRAAYCHRVIRHTVLWAHAFVEKQDAKVNGEPVAMEPGACSNPDPPASILDLPLGPIDIAWYLLAQTEIAARLRVGVRDSIPQRFVEGPIPILEFGLFEREIRDSVDTLDLGRYSVLFLPYVEGVAYFVEGLADGTVRSFDALSPDRGVIPHLNREALLNSAALDVANDALLAFGIRAALAGRPEDFVALQETLDTELGEGFPGHLLFEYYNDGIEDIPQLARTVLDIIKLLNGRAYLEPLEFWMSGLRFFEQIIRSKFEPLLTRALAEWMAAGWRRIIDTETFRLITPTRTIPAVEAVLIDWTASKQFVARLTLAASAAVGARLNPAYRIQLEAMATE